MQAVKITPRQLPPGKCTAEMARHAYYINDISVVGWLYVLLERKHITVIGDLEVHQPGNTTDALHCVTISFEFPGYQTWLDFNCLIKGQPIEYATVYDDTLYQDLNRKAA